MQNQKMTNESVLIAIPADFFEEAEIGENDLIQITAEKGKITITREDNPDRFICDRDCASCPVGEFGCDECCEEDFLDEACDVGDDYYDDEYESEVF